VVLLDDAFATIVAAIEQGRVIFEAIRRFVLYLLSCNAAEVLVVGLGALAETPLPLLPLQILFLNLVTDVFPALALAGGEPGPDVMRRPPRPPSEPVLTRAHWAAVAGGGALLAAPVLAAFAWAHGAGLDPGQCVTVTFVALAAGQLAHVFNMAGALRLRRDGIVDNGWVWAAVAGCLALVVAAVRWPALAVPLGTSDPGPRGWLVALAAGLAPLVAGQALLHARRLLGRSAGRHDGRVARPPEVP